MNSFSRRSEAHLSTCHPLLQTLLREVIKEKDCTVICGHRGRIEQEAHFVSGASKARYGESLHNFYPSLAVDVMPCPLDWNDKQRVTEFAKYVLETAKKLGIPIRSGIDWDRDGIFWEKENWEVDGPHYELVGVKGELQ